MKKLAFVLFLSIMSHVQAQILQPVKWSTSVTEISATEYELVATATINSGWHLYSQTVAENGPTATKFTFEGNKKYLKKGNTSEENGHTINDPIFEMKIKYFEKKAIFKQRIKVKSKGSFVIKGIVEFMACDDSKCLPATEVDLVFNIK